MTFWEGAGVFAGIPLLVLFLLAVPIFGPVWRDRWRGRRRAGAGSRSGDRSGRGPDDSAP